MTSFSQAVSRGATTTTNGMTALRSSGSELTDMFFSVGACRNNQDKAINDFVAAFSCDPLIAMKIMFWARDVRGGAGERQTFRTLIKQLEKMRPDLVIKNLHLIPKFGRWDDLYELGEDPMVKTAVFKLVADTLTNQTDGWQLCSKWTPRKGKIAVELRNFMKLSPKAYRKMLVNGTNVVETAMCAQNWDTINYSHVPSVAAKNYQMAFNRHSPTQYAAYRAALKNGTAKINASAIFPHDVIRGTDVEVVEAQWKALPNYLEGNNTSILPMIDVSGSMECRAGKNSNTTCMDIAISLGLYIAEKQEGPFAGLYLTFTDQPTLEAAIGSNIVEKFNFIRYNNVGYNTNIQSAFEEILRVAKANNVSDAEMPKTLLIFSDMQFDSAICGDQVEYSPTMMNMAKDMYAAAGYTLPKIVYWNLNAYDNVPVGFDQCGTAMVSGFSPAIMKSILSSDLNGISPFSIMMDAVNGSRYSEVQV